MFCILAQNYLICIGHFFIDYQGKLSSLCIQSTTQVVFCWILSSSDSQSDMGVWYSITLAGSDHVGYILQGSFDTDSCIFSNIAVIWHYWCYKSKSTTVVWPYSLLSIHSITMAVCSDKSNFISRQVHHHLNKHYTVHHTVLISTSFYSELQFRIQNNI